MAQLDLFGETPAPVPRIPQSAAVATAPRHSWFFAVRPSAEDAARIDAIAERLHASFGVTGKRLRPDRLHISLDAIGEGLDAALVDAACRAADTVRLPAMHARFDAAMTFGGPSAPFVLLGTDGLDGVRKLRTVLACALADRGFKLRRAHKPHMTLSYDPHNRVERVRIEPIEFAVAGFALIKSHVGLTRHETVRSWELA